MSTEGTVDGGKFRFQAAHIEWLLRFGQSLGLTFDDIGKRRHGTPSTLRFCDELFRLYGSDDYNEAMGAAFAVENWAATGFWKELISGLEKVKAAKVPDMPLAFFTWHDKIENQHKAHVCDELRECYNLQNLDKVRDRRKSLIYVSDGYDLNNKLRGFFRRRVAPRRPPPRAVRERATTFLTALIHLSQPTLKSVDTTRTWVHDGAH